MCISDDHCASAAVVAAVAAQSASRDSEARVIHTVYNWSSNPSVVAAVVVVAVVVSAQ